MNTKVIDVDHKLMILTKASGIERLKPNPTPSRNILSLHCLGFDNFHTDKDDPHSFTHVYPFLDRIEIKPEKFVGAEKLFLWQGSSYIPHDSNHARLLELRYRNNLRAQFHFPFHARKGDISLTMANPSHHDMLLNMFAAYALAGKDYDYDPNITIHPPDVADHRNENEIKQALENTNRFLCLLGETIAGESWNIIVCVENQPEPQGLTEYIEAAGYTVNQLQQMVSGTNDRIQFTVDAGHRRLSAMGVQDIVNLCLKTGKYIAEFHIHSNSGRQAELIAAGKSSDKHEPMYPWNVHGYYMYLVRSILEDIPFNLEVKINQYDKGTMVRYFTNLREEIDRTYAVLTESQT